VSTEEDRCLLSIYSSVDCLGLRRLPRTNAEIRSVCVTMPRTRPRDSTGSATQPPVASSDSRMPMGVVRVAVSIHHIHNKCGSPGWAEGLLL
jgi:hypothetical protein